MTPEWPTAVFGCLIRDSVAIRSLLRTQLSASLPAPFLSRKADLSATVRMDFAIALSDGEFRAWQQWFAYELNDGALPFTMFLPWGTEQPQVRARLTGNWSAQGEVGHRWTLSGQLEIERESLPQWSGGAR